MTRTHHYPAGQTFSDLALPGAEERPLLSIADLEQLQSKALERKLRSRHRATSPIIGQRPSGFRGHGMELEDVRAYQAGDDVRYMDWRATARSGKPIMKVFREERTQGLFLMIDRRPSMHFGTRGELKAVTAARSAAILAFSALGMGDSVAGMVVENAAPAHPCAHRTWASCPADEKFFPGARDINNVLQLLRAASAPLAALPIADRHTVIMSTLLAQIDRAAARGASVCLISDFKDLRAEHVPALLQLTANHEVLAVQIIDPGEETLPDAGKLRMASPGGELFVVDTADAGLRTRYAQAMAKQHADLDQLFSRTGISLQRLYTHKDTFEQLACHESFGECF